MQQWTALLLCARESPAALMHRDCAMPKRLEKATTMPLWPLQPVQSQASAFATETWLMESEPVGR